jgi:nucleoside-diphosphate kinase
MAETFLMIKPSAVAAGHVGGIIDAVERAGFKMRGAASRRLTRAEAEVFYDVHEGKEFFESLVAYVTSGLTLGLVLEAPDAVTLLRRTVGATDPADAAPGTVRALFGDTLQRNAVHASDSPERVQHELAVYFGDCPRALISQAGAEFPSGEAPRRVDGEDRSSADRSRRTSGRR